MDLSSKRMVNSTEIARIAGLSRSTVSRVINNHPNVNEETRNKVMKIIEQFGYAPNASARVLAGKKVDTIGLFFAAGEPSVNSFVEDTHANFMLACIAETASQLGYLTLTSIIREIESFETNKRIKDVFLEGRIDAGIFIGFPNYTPVVEELIAKGFVIGILDQYIQGRNEVNRIVANLDEECAKNAVEYLVSLGHRRIMGVHGDLKRYSGMQKHDSFIDGMKKNSLEIRKEWQLFADFNRTSAFNVVADYLKSKSELPTSIFCSNDSIAFGVMEALKNAGLSIPEDISVIGVDDSGFSAYLTPPLTTFRVDFQNVLGELTRKVIEGLRDLVEEPVRMSFGSELVIRGSCRKIG